MGEDRAGGDVGYYLMPGALVAAIGFCVVWGLLASQGGLAKSRQFEVIGRIASGRAGTRQRLLLGVGALLLLGGTCGLFAGVGADDLRRDASCRQACLSRGYAAGTIRGSTAMEGDNKHAFVACACTGGPDPDPLELVADDLP